MATLTETGVDGAAAAWLARLQRGPLEPGEQEQFEHWLDADPRHAVAFARAESYWERAARLQALPRKGFGSGIAARLPGWMPAAIAACLVVVCAALIHTYRSGDELATEVGDRKALRLADGSLIRINSASRVSVHLNAHQRTVRLLEGEALFTVAPDPSRPFVVEVGGTAVRALGTEFNVRMRDQLVEVAVTEGLVAVEDVRVAAGASVIVAQGAVNRISTDEDDVRRRVAWRNGIIELKGETLGQAVDEFNRYSREKLIVADPSIAALRVGGRFETDESRKFVHALEAGFGLRTVEGSDGNIYLFGRP